MDLPKNSPKSSNAVLFLQTLKSSTANQHILLESNVLIAAMVAPEVSVREYYWYLTLMKKIEETYEKMILSKLAVILPLSQHKITSQIITQDVKAIGYVPPDNIGIKPYTLKGKHHTIAFALGYTYVMKGSKLGGMVIAKHVQRNLGFSENNGAKFISDRNADTISLWKEFLSIFSKYVVEHKCEKEAIQGAKFAFSSIYNYFESNRIA